MVNKGPLGNKDATDKGEHPSIFTEKALTLKDVSFAAI